MESGCNGWKKWGAVQVSLLSLKLIYTLGLKKSKPIKILANINWSDLEDVFSEFKGLVGNFKKQSDLLLSFGGEEKVNISESEDDFILVDFSKNKSLVQQLNQALTCWLLAADEKLIEPWHRVVKRDVLLQESKIEEIDDWQMVNPMDSTLFHHQHYGYSNEQVERTAIEYE
ncbi:hypothetical protein [Piscirickettsia litoralis]|uniref:Uncharacterized protein n=1 Tax=Piscirickettsia litoralis TaxID=1891921 RepID=A0ABX3A437_9GAMM|nr:hypothetical protein [Piscirickettsia litoralis]ODN42413.1 hypothetical protein BGC07_05035 [Piscirickettsia litoralis]